MSDISIGPLRHNTANESSPIAGLSAKDLPSTSSVSAPSRELAGLDMGRGAKPSADQVVQEFQGILLGEMLKAMRQTVQESGLFEEGGFAQETYRSLLDQEYVQSMSKQMGGLGMTEALKRQLGLDGKMEPRG